MFCPVAGWGKQGEQQIHGPVVDGPIGDGRIQPDEHRRHPRDTFKPGVRNCDPGTKPGRTQGLAFQQGLHDPAFRQAKRVRGGFSHRVQGLTL